ncbi:transcriptional regulator [Nitrogeniibacter mangrovi]|uniref:Transcriptional regulator n=1 Tax=Nitrogeniibacter mangrovi TaxID=2016596 RepID=A0A6C1B6P9_9RHOO|nr:transcriptional regulator [Nitrogeniibacter mangrovi]QID19371.1 transcriptional regulator [Nitrogeniibacter mangrovi]
MSVRLNIQLSEDLNCEIDRVASQTATDKGEILRKALLLFLAACEGRERGLKFGLVDPASGKLETEIIGL